MERGQYLAPHPRSIATGGYRGVVYGTEKQGESGRRDETKKKSASCAWRERRREGGRTKEAKRDFWIEGEVRLKSRITPQIHIQGAGRQGGAIKPVRRADWEWAVSLPQ